MKKWLPWTCLVVFALWFLSGARAPEPKNKFDLTLFGRLPVLLNGRIQPMDTVARNALLSMRGKSTVRAVGNTLSATEWMLEAMTKPELADQRKVFRVQAPELEGLLGADKPGLNYYAYNDFTNQLPQLQSQIQTLAKSEESRDDAAKNRTAYQKDLMHLYSSLMLYRQIKNSLQPEGCVDFPADIAAYKAALGPAMTAVRKQDVKEEFDKSAMDRLSPLFHEFQDMASVAYPLAVPPKAGDAPGNWRNIGASLIESARTEEIHPAIPFLAAIASSYAKNRPQDFRAAVAGYESWLQANNLDASVQKSRHEFLFNQLEPFYKAMVVYVAALILGCIFWINMSESVRKTGVMLLVLGFVIHTLGLGFRMWLEGRPPVTNLYSSAIFIGWGAVLLGLILERLFKGAIGLVASSLIGFITLIIAHHLSLSGDTMEMLRAVLDTNLWLATHVVTITIGYSSMFLAGLLAVIYVVAGFFTSRMSQPVLDGAAQSQDLGNILTRMVYGIVCFSTIFSFVGTVLGGIWADQSWGRFWGWDPKENGALLIVLWNAIILHLRWGGMIKDRGLMAMAVGGNIVTSFSWFGVNMLGVGLHSYGFMDAAFPWLVAFVASQVVIIVLALMSERFWASFKSASR